MSESETVDIGGVAVPKAFAERWNELLGANRKLKSQLTEASAALTLAQEEAATGSSKELEKATARIKELEGELEGSAWSSALSEDGLADDPDTLEYLQYQYNKLQAEEGKAKPSVKDWYPTFREKSSVVQAAKKVAEAAKRGKAKEAPGTEAPANGKPAPPNGTKVTVSTRTPPKQIPSDSGTVTADSLVQMDVRDFAANKETLRKQLFGS